MSKKFLFTMTFSLLVLAGQAFAQCDTTAQATYDACVAVCDLASPACVPSDQSRILAALNSIADDCDADLLDLNGKSRNAYRDMAQRLRKLGVISKAEAQALRNRLKGCKAGNGNGNGHDDDDDNP